MKLSKSLAELDSAADELLAKSKAAVKEKDEELKPKEISDDSTSTPDTEEGAGEGSDEDLENETGDEKDNEPNEEQGDDEKPEKGNVKKSDEEVKKSEQAAENSEEEPADEETEKSESGDNPEDEETAEDLGKSLQMEFQDNPYINNGIVNNEFLSAVVELLTKSLGEMQYETFQASKTSEAVNDVMAKSMNSLIAANAVLKADNDRLNKRISALEKSISDGFEKIMDSLDEISSQPTHMRKSMRSVNVQDRNFDISLDGVRTSGGFESLSKSEVMTILNNELYSGNPNVQTTDIISYESGAPLRPELQSLVASKIK